MKTLLFFLLMMFSLGLNAQDFTYDENVYTPTSQRASEWIETPYLYTCRDGSRQVILVNKKNGRCAYQKPGNKSKTYINNESICKDVCRKMNIPYTYVPKKRK